MMYCITKYSNYLKNITSFRLSRAYKKTYKAKRVSVSVHNSFLPFPDRARATDADLVYLLSLNMNVCVRKFNE